MWPEGLCQKKIPVAPLGIEPAKLTLTSALTYCACATACRILFQTTATNTWARSCPVGHCSLVFMLSIPLAGCRTRYFVIPWFADPGWCRHRNTDWKRSIICKWYNSCLFQELIRRRHQSKSQSTLSHGCHFVVRHSKYRVIHKSLRDFRTRLRNNQDRHGRKEHINR